MSLTVRQGKSMLIDLFADCLPNRKKKRWHFTTFMLEVLSKLEQLRRSRQTIIPTALGTQDDYSLLWLARDMISTSPILFLDEFQLPDRAASKIMTNLMTSFFHLGGVLIASSNRMPEELAKAAGMEFAAPPPPSRMDSVRWRLGIRGRNVGRGSDMYGNQSDFGKFLEVLRARCEVWEMEGGKDYRRRESETDTQDPVGEEAEHVLRTQGFEGLEEMSAGNVGLGYEQSKPADDASTNDPATMKRATLPKNFLLKPAADDSTDAHTSFASNFAGAERKALNPSTATTRIDWQPSTLRVYGRSVNIPRQDSGVANFTFSELCGTPLGPADYITLASTYHTIVLTDVPVLTILMKNEARRFITLLDALYEARCKLLITAAAGPDELFFPEQHRSSTSGEETVTQDQTLPETLSEVYQDATAPFRPNVSSYDPGVASPDEPDFTHARLAGMLAEDSLEDDPPNRPHRSKASSHHDGMGRGDSIYGLDTNEDQSLDQLRQQLARQRGSPNFQDAGVFTGEDEKFAYKRARSRLWEMCGKRWWERNDADNAWWRPLGTETRRWEQSIDERTNVSGSVASTHGSGATAREGLVGETPLDEQQDSPLHKWGLNVNPALGRTKSTAYSDASSPRSSQTSPSKGESTSTSPFRTSTEPPPKIPWTHMWGFMRWGKKAGAWGKGVEGLDEREVERKRRKDEAAVAPVKDPDDVGKRRR